MIHVSAHDSAANASLIWSERVNDLARATASACRHASLRKTTRAEKRNTFSAVHH